MEEACQHAGACDCGHHPIDLSQTKFPQSGIQIECASDIRWNQVGRGNAICTGAFQSPNILVSPRWTVVEIKRAIEEYRG